MKHIKNCLNKDLGFILIYFKFSNNFAKEYKFIEFCILGLSLLPYRYPTDSGYTYHNSNCNCNDLYIEIARI